MVLAGAGGVGRETVGDVASGLLGLIWGARSTAVRGAWWLARGRLLASAPNNVSGMTIAKPMRSPEPITRVHPVPEPGLSQALVA